MTKDTKHHTLDIYPAVTEQCASSGVGQLSPAACGVEWAVLYC